MTNDQTQRFDTTEMQGQHEHHEPDSGSAHSRRRRRVAVALIAALVAVGAGATAVLLSGAPGSSKDTASVAGAAVAPPEVSEPTSGNPTPEPQPPAAPGHLVVSTTYHGLETNDFSGSFEITNDGESDIEWSWSGDSRVMVSSEGGVLAPGESVVVEFSIAWQQLKNGPFAYVNSVDGGDQSIAVTITGTRDIKVNPGIQLPNPQIAPND